MLLTVLYRMFRGFSHLGNRAAFDEMRNHANPPSEQEHIHHREQSQRRQQLRSRNGLRYGVLRKQSNAIRA